MSDEPGTVLLRTIPSLDYTFRAGVAAALHARGLSCSVHPGGIETGWPGDALKAVEADLARDYPR